MATLKIFVCDPVKSNVMLDITMKFLYIKIIYTINHTVSSKKNELI